MIDVLEKIIPHIKHESDTLLELFEKFYSGTLNDNLAYVQYGSINELVTIQREFSRRLLKDLFLCDKPFVVGYISTIYLSLAKDDLSGVHEELIELKNHSSKHVIYGVVNALGGLDYQTNELVDVTLVTLAYIERRDINSVDACIANACGQLVGKNQDSLRMLERLSQKNTPQIDFEILGALLRAMDNNSSSPWFESMLMTLARTKQEYRGVIDRLDLITGNLIRDSHNRNLAENFLISWIQNSDYLNREGGRLDRLFDLSFHSLIKEQRGFQKFLTRLFSHESHKIHSAAAELVDYANLHKMSVLSFDKEQLKLLSYEDLLFMARKILGYIIDSKTMCSLAFSLLEYSPRNKQVQGLVYTLFSDYIGVDYPDTTINFLRAVKEKDKGIIKSRIADGVIARIHEHQEARQALPELKEIIPPSHQTTLILREQSKIMSQSLEKAQEGSIVNLFKTLQLKHGSGAFSYKDADYSAPSKLSSYSTTMELPVSERNYPVSAAIQRFEFRRAKKGD